MTDSIANGYRYLAKKFDAGVVPVGSVWKNVRYESTIDLYASDRAHPSKFGSFLIASTFFKSIFDTKPDRKAKLVDGKKASIIINQVEKYVDENASGLGIKGRTFSVRESSNQQEKGRFSYEFGYANPNLDSIQWFLNGKLISIENAGRIAVKTKRRKNYHLKAVVTLNCGKEMAHTFLLHPNQAVLRRREEFTAARE